MRNDYERKLDFQRKLNQRLEGKVKQLEKYADGDDPLPPYETANSQEYGRRDESSE